MCVSVCVHCAQVSGGPRTAFMSQFSAAIMCVLAQAVRPVWQTLWLMSHLTSQGCECFKIVVNIYHFCHLNHLNTILSNHQPSTPQF